MNKKFKNKKVTAWRKGVKSEWLASFYLRLKGYRILKTRYKTPVGEIDLIAKTKTAVIFIEVKQRATVSGALFSISAHQRRRIERAGQYFLSKHPHLSHLHLRFDAIAITSMCWPKHLKGAWRFGE